MFQFEGLKVWKGYRQILNYLAICLQQTSDCLQCVWSLLDPDGYFKAIKLILEVKLPVKLMHMSHIKHNLSIDTIENSHAKAQSPMDINLFSPLIKKILHS